MTQTTLSEQPIRGLTRLWRARHAENRSADPPTAPRAAEGDLLERICRARGIEPASRHAFFHPVLGSLHDPSAIPDLDRAAQRILDALDRRERIVIYGDYDVDGATATAILHHMVHAIAPGADLHTYVPHRLEEGYGLNTQAIEQLAAEGAQLIVTVDCGVTAVEQALTARRLGVDLIITDHHTPPSSVDRLPRAFAVVHPGRPDSDYPFDGLCGAGVAYKLAWRMATLHCASERVSQELRELLLHTLAFAALGSIADVVPLVDENRVLARFGLPRIPRCTLAGVAALVDAAGLTGGRIDEQAVGFALAPRLNACGRLGHAAETVELLTTATGDRAAEIARQLCSINDRRRRVEQRIAADAAQRAQDAGMLDGDSRAIVLAADDWHRGVVGIVCSRLVDRFCRPAILLHRDNGTCHGSGRSFADFDLYSALARCEDLLDSFGGHRHAAGLSLRTDRLEAFQERFAALAREALAAREPVAEHRWDAEAHIAELTPAVAHELERFAPHGAGNPSLTLLLRRCRIVEAPGTFGSGGAHLRLTLSQRPRTLRVVAWKWAEHLPRLHAGMEVDALVRPKLSRYWNPPRVEGELLDIRPA